MTIATQAFIIRFIVLAPLLLWLIWLAARWVNRRYH